MSCPFEDRTLQATARGVEDPWLADHAASCLPCAEIADAAAAMKILEDPAPETARRLPSAGQIWFKARVAGRRAAEEKAMRPLRLVESAAVAVALLLAVAALAGVRRGMPAVWESLASWARAVPLSITGPVAIALVVSALIVAMAVHRLLARR